MYHYVREQSKDYPYFRFLHVDDFEKQLNFFEKEFGFVSKEDFIESFTTGIPVDGVILTFDDGLKDHYQFVFSELQKRNLWGIFYVSTGNYQSKQLLGVHATHLLLGKYGGKKIWEALLEIITDDMLIDKKVSSFRNNTYITQSNDEYTTEVKKILNYYISYEAREKVLAILKEKLLEAEEKIVKDFYLSLDEIKEMQDSGMIIGSHSVDHSVMSKLSFQQQQYQIETSFEFLEKITKGLVYKTFCYPYGGFHSFTNETESILTNNKCLFSFNVEPRDISADDLINRKQALPRYDCNMFESGQVADIAGE